MYLSDYQKIGLILMGFFGYLFWFGLLVDLGKWIPAPMSVGMFFLFLPIFLGGFYLFKKK